MSSTSHFELGAYIYVFIADFPIQGKGNAIVGVFIVDVSFRSWTFYVVLYDYLTTDCSPNQSWVMHMVGLYVK